MSERKRICRWNRLVLGVLLVAASPAYGAAPHAHTVEVDGHPLRVWEKAPAAPRSTMLLIHGRTWSSRPDFDLQVPGEARSLMDGLVGQGTRALAVDLRGYGETPRDTTGWLTPRRAADDVIGVLAWLERTGGAPVHLFGWSYGALVAQLVAQARPDLVAGLILFGYPLRPGIDVDPPNAADAPPRLDTTAAAAAADFILPEAATAATVESFVAAALAADPVRADWRDLAEWRLLDPALVTVPVLLLEAFHDPLARDDQHAALFTALGTDDKAWVVIPGGAHAAFLEAPRGYFLRQVDAFVHR
ncbi:MAG: alpha/beta fold hydrolase [Pseudomonadales bacterium]|nr:alpha/beta fold hydrolase [Pseudomonadales bacterium]